MVDRVTASGMEHAPPDVSFIVCAFNVAPYIETAIRSALAQVDVKVEVIVVDDASTDETSNIVADIAENDPRVVLITREKNAGPSVARNRAIGHAIGKWIAILDGDDLITPQRTRKLLDLATATSADMVADNFERFYEEGKPTGQTMIPRVREPYSLIVDVAAFINGNITFSQTRFALGAIKPMFRSKFLRNNQIKFKENIHVGEDYHFCLAGLMAGAHFVVTSFDTYKYRMRPGSQSWRLKEIDIDRLLREHKALGLEQRYSDNKQIMRASNAYATALVHSAKFQAIVSSIKSGRLREALWATITQPEIWTLLGRFSGEALLKRLKSLATFSHLTRAPNERTARNG